MPYTALSSAHRQSSLVLGCQDGIGGMQTRISSKPYDVTEGGTKWEELKPTEMAETEGLKIHIFKRNNLIFTSQNISSFYSNTI
jgi:hypothetical protein